MTPRAPDAPEVPGGTFYLDALSGPLYEPQDAIVNTALSNGKKPPWGWDYVLSFKIPHELRQQFARSTSKRKRRSQGDSGQALGLDGKDLERSRQMVRTRIDILARLRTAGFVFSQILVPSEGVILVRLSLPENVMKQKAMKLGMELQLKDKYGGGYLDFQRDREECFVNQDIIRDCYFGPADRMIIIMGVMQSKEDWGCGLNIERMLYDESIFQAFALHTAEREVLAKKTVWKRLWDPSFVPDFTAMKDYLGARVTFYFVFVSFYARNLLIISLLSVPIYLFYRLQRNIVTIAVMRWIFSIGLVLWTTIFLERWKRRNANVNLRWGLDDYKEDTVDDVRVQFTGGLRHGFYCEGGFVSLSDLVGEAANGRTGAQSLPQNPYQDPIRARNTRIQSIAVSSFFVLLVGVLTFLLLWYRNRIVGYVSKRTGHEAFAQAVPGILNGVLITVFDTVWRPVSLMLVRRENHRTNQAFENSLVYKRFAFQFISNYVSLFYIAFIRPYMKNTCSIGQVTGAPDCVLELESQLTSLLITKSTIGQVAEVGVPFITRIIKQWRAKAKSNEGHVSGMKFPGQAKTSSGRSRYVQESKLAEYSSTLEDYGELVLQFGYVALFGLAFPPAAVIALLNNLIEGRVDAYKILVLSQRVVADDAADIGAWYPILEFLNVLSVITNAGLVMFTADVTGVVFDFDSRYGDDVWRKVLYRVVAFFVMEHILLSVKAGTAYLIPDVPSAAKRAAARKKFDIARSFGVGWRDEFRGNSLLTVDDAEHGACERYADSFSVASDDDDTFSD